MSKLNALKEKEIKAVEKVNKIEQTIERHQKQLKKKEQVLLKLGYSETDLTEDKLAELKSSVCSTATMDIYWAVVDVQKKLDDIRRAHKKLESAKESLEKTREKFQVEQNKEQFIKGQTPQVILDFLDKWKTDSYEWYKQRYNDYLDLSKTLEEQANNLRRTVIKTKSEYSEYLDEKGEIKDYWINGLLYLDKTKPLKFILEEQKLDTPSVKKQKADFAGGVVLHMDTFYDENERLSWLDNQLEKEKEAKMYELINRITATVGELLDAEQLKINQKGNLDGFIVGKEGKAKIETIGAAGYNIQRFHYRTLVHAV
ncbi:hypothetical protein CN918_29455 [Priestia megaterium]|nr:hypothetical protein CN918_29455 [Priestia megaterium]